MRHWKQLLATLLFASLAACGGGGGDAGTPVLGAAGTAKDLVIGLSAETISNSGAETVTATITAVDANRNGVEGVKVKVAVDNDAVVSVPEQRTDASGKLSVEIGIGSNRTTRDITITAWADGKTSTRKLRVVPDPNGLNAVAADLTLEVTPNALDNGSDGKVTATAVALDENRNIIRGVPVSFAVDSGATIAPGSPVTGNDGKVTAAVGLGGDLSNRVVTVTARSSGLTRTATFIVRGARLTASASPLVDAGSVNNLIEYTLVDSGSHPMVNQPISVSADGLPTVTRNTDHNGRMRYEYTAPSTPGVITIVADGGGDRYTQAVTVSSAATVPAATQDARSASIRPTPSVIAVNTAGSDRNQVELRALFIGADDRPIQNMRARFDIVGGASDAYGRVSVVGNYAYSDANGVARASFIPGTVGSPNNGVTVRVCWDRTDFVTPAPNSCAGATNVAISTLTVNEGSISVSIGHNRDIKAGRNDLTYIKEYVVMVVNESGHAVPNAQITPSVELKGYYKGRYSWDGDKWALPGPTGSELAPTEKYEWSGTTWVLGGPADAEVMCPNEDFNRNGVLETLGAVQEDLNGNGRLEPRQAAVAVSMVDSARTDENGLAIVQIEYPKDHGSWIRFELAVTAAVAGTEGKAVYGGVLPVEASELTSETIPPSFVRSPYGTATTCSNPN
ncbi:MAG TPA: hypothetical protein PKJ45_01085 [Rubrivivax sp.]|nr:hypothetical protein [Rubrivivax sp.]